MKGSFKLLAQDNLIKVSILISLILIVIQAVLTFFSYQSFPPLIPLLNSQPWGSERLFNSASIFLILPIFLLVFICNNMLSAAFYKTNTLISRVLSFNCLLFIFLGVLAYVQIILLVL